MLPRARADLSWQEHRQHLYSNLWVQLVRLARSTATYTDAEAQAAVRQLFRSPIARQARRATGDFRKVSVVPGSPEDEFTQLVDAISREYDEVRAAVPVPDESGQARG